MPTATTTALMTDVRDAEAELPYRLDEQSRIVQFNKQSTAPRTNTDFLRRIYDEIQVLYITTVSYNVRILV